MVEVTRGGQLRYENSPSLQRLLKRLEKECGLVLPVDQVNYSLYLDRASQWGTGWMFGCWGWTASVHEQPKYGVLGSEQPVTRLLRCKVLKMKKHPYTMGAFRIEVLGGDRK